MPFSRDEFSFFPRREESHIFFNFFCFLPLRCCRGVGSTGVRNVVSTWVEVFRHLTTHFFSKYYTAIEYFSRSSVAIKTKRLFEQTATNLPVVYEPEQQSATYFSRSTEKTPPTPGSCRAIGVMNPLLLVKFRSPEPRRFMEMKRSTI